MCERLVLINKDEFLHEIVRNGLGQIYIMKADFTNFIILHNCLKTKKKAFC